MIPCGKLREEWKQFVLGHMTCKVDADCKIVGLGFQGCNCIDGISPVGGRAISISGLEEAKKYIKKYHSNECYEYRGRACEKDRIFIYDNVSCVVGTCVISGKSRCL
jgi:hypothetical protein